MRDLRETPVSEVQAAGHSEPDQVPDKGQASDPAEVDNE
jgi:hypothetical protein